MVMTGDDGPWKYSGCLTISELRNLSYANAYIRPTGPRPQTNNTLEDDPDLKEALVFTMLVCVAYLLVLVIYYWTLCYQKFTLPSEEDNEEVSVSRRASLVLTTIRKSMLGSEELLAFREKVAKQKKTKAKEKRDSTVSKNADNDVS
jgi:heme/copper-type cytochrome/quinol oxidase subunit 2